MIGRALGQNEELHPKYKITSPASEAVDFMVNFNYYYFQINASVSVRVCKSN